MKKTKNPVKFTFKMKKKLLWTFVFVGIALVILSGVMLKINLDKGMDYSKAVYNNFTYDSRTIPARRGNITDRNGTVLAYSTKVYNLIIDMKVMLSDSKYKEPTMQALLDCFDIDETELREYAADNESKKAAGKTVDSYRRWLKELTGDEIAEFEKLMEDDSSIKGVWFEEQYKRTYPYQTLAADLIGFSSDANGGELGIESCYNEYLAGVDGREYGYIDNSAYSTNIINAENGATVVSTIDYTIQSIVEQAILDFNEEYGSTSTSVIVTNPNTGEILASADYPSFDLNNPRDLSGTYTQEQLDAFTDEEKVDALFSIWTNNCISWIYEPGSVFKTLTVAEGLEEGIVKLDDTFECDGEGVYNASKILCHGGEGHGVLTLAGTLMESCNDALMQMGMSIGVEQFTKYFDIFQLGSKTEIDLPSEAEGLLISADGMMDVDLVTNAFGQNLNVTMVQMAGVFASIINGGNYYRPYTVDEVISYSGDTILENEPVLVSKTISEETSEKMRAVLRTVVDYGTGAYVYLDGYSIGGKTGTAEKQPRDKQEYVVSFMGFAPAENPEVLVYVVIDAPQCENYDSSWAAQMISKQIFEGILPYLKIEPDYADYSMDIWIDAEKTETIHTSGRVPAPVVDDNDEDETGENQEGETVNTPENETGDTPEGGTGSAPEGETTGSEEATTAATENETIDDTGQ